jgi:hypothetical protein
LSPGVAKSTPSFPHTAGCGLNNSGGGCDNERAWPGFSIKERGMQMWMQKLALAAAAMAAAAWLGGEARAAEPEELNPFGAVKRDRDDALSGYLEMSDGRVFVGNIYMTRDKRLKMEDSSRQVGGGDSEDDKSDKRQREIPLRAIKQIDCKVENEWMEKEWRFKELALDEKYYTGRVYPARKYVHTITLKDGRKLTGPLAEILYVKPFRELTAGARSDEDTEEIRFMLHKRDKGEPGTTLKALAYVKLVKLGDDAVEEGKKKAAKAEKASPAGTKKKPLAKGKKRPSAEAETPKQENQ